MESCTITIDHLASDGCVGVHVLLTFGTQDQLPGPQRRAVRRGGAAGGDRVPADPGNPVVSPARVNPFTAIAGLSFKSMFRESAIFPDLKISSEEEKKILPKTSVSDVFSNSLYLLSKRLHLKSW